MWPPRSGISRLGSARIRWPWLNREQRGDGGRGARDRRGGAANRAVGHATAPIGVGTAGGSLSGMSAKEKLLSEAPRWSEEQAAIALRAVEADGEPEMAELPEAWKTFDDGTPVPNWVALLERSRRGH